MAQTNFTPILTYKSDTASAVPSAGNLTNSANGAELAVNTADKRLFTKDSGGSVVELGTNPSSLTLPNGTANGVVYANGSKVLTTGSALTFDGTNFATTGSVSSAGASNSGNLAFTGTGNRITGDFSNATLANRVMFQTSTVNGQTSVGVLPNGTSTITNLNLFGGIDPANASIGQLVNTGTEVRLGAIVTGTGTYLPMTFYTGGSERMRLDTAGNVGIGTSSPGAKLEVYAGDLLVNRASGNAALGIKTTGGSGRTYYLVSDVGGSFQIYDNNASANRVTLDSSGNLGLGVTPSAWGTAYFKAIQGNGGASLQFQQNANGVALGCNYYFNSSLQYIYVNSDYASNYYQNAGTHKWYTAPSGTAGNAISFTQAMTLDASGRLAIGRTTAGAMLDVEVTTANTNVPTLAAHIRTSTSGTAAAGLGGYISFLTENSNGSQYETAYIGAATESSTSADKDGYIFFSTALNTANPVERARIDSSGNFLVGGTTANARIYSQGLTSSGYGVGSQTSGAGAALYGGWSGSTLVYVVYGNGNVGNANNSYGAISDVKLKENIVDATPKLEKLNQVRVVNYNLKTAPDQNLIGVIAQELEQIFPGMVEETPDRDAEGNDLGTTTKSVKYSVFVPMLIKAMQEQQAIIEQLKAQLTSVSTDVAALKGA